MINEKMQQCRNEVKFLKNGSRIKEEKSEKKESNQEMKRK